MTRPQQGQGSDLEDSASIPDSLGMPLLPQQCGSTHLRSEFHLLPKMPDTGSLHSGRRTQ